MAGGQRFDIEEGKSIYAKEWEVMDRGNLVTLWYTGSWTWKKIENNGAGNKKLLVARSNKRYNKIYRWIWHVLENKKFNRNTSREVDSKWIFRNAMDIFNSRLYHKVTISSRKKYDFGSMW